MNRFGNKYRITIWGESHGKAVGITIDGCPPGVELSVQDFEADLGRRRSGAKGTTPRREADQPNIISGVYNGFTTGAPITIIVENTNTRSKDYKDLPFRPGHADFVAHEKFMGYNDPRGGGHFSGRLTVCLVIAGVIAKKLLPHITIQAHVKEIGGTTDIETAIDNAIVQNDSIGGVVECRVSGMSIGIGEPFFDSLESVIAHLVFAIPAIKGIEFGSGFKAATMLGSQHNDLLLDEKGTTASNNAGGINGGISNGNDLVFRVAVKPTSSIGTAQRTYNNKEKRVSTLAVGGRHDACIALRVPVALEAVTAIGIADAYFENQHSLEYLEPLQC